MPRPGTTLTRSETRVSRAARTGTGPWFIAGTTGTSDTDPEGVTKPVRNLSEYAARFGARVAHVNDGGGGPFAMYDAADEYFVRGGSELYVSPAVYHATPATYETNLGTALGRLVSDLGPGQESVPGRTTPETKLAVANHARDTNRIAVLATSNTANLATMTAEATIAGIGDEAEEHASLFGPWVTIPGPLGVGTRLVSPEAIVAGTMALNDADGISPNQPSAGQLYGQIDEALSVEASFGDADRATLNINGVNLLRPMFGGVWIYGYRTLADPTTNPNWTNLGNARLFMAVQAQFDAVAERYVFRELDGQRHVINEFGGELTGQLVPFWRAGSLYGATPAEAFRVDVGVNVNTDATIANKQLRANIILKTSEFAEEVVLELVKARITEALPV